jgi:hypothetical protein
MLRNVVLTFAAMSRLIRWGLGALILLAGTAGPSAGQGFRNVRDSALVAPHFHVHGGMGVPTGALATRFGSGGTFGAGFHVKERSGWMWGVQGTWFFGAPVKEPGLLGNLLTPAGELIDNEGQVAFVTPSGRAGVFSAEVGRVFRTPGMRANANSGWLVKAGLASIHHRVHFENTENEITQLSEPYLAGYDRLTWGIGGTGFAGYWHMGSSGRVNAYAGLSGWWGRLESVRPINFDTGQADAPCRLDGMVGLQAGWVFQIYKLGVKTHWR